MARLTILFIKKDEKGMRKTVKTVEIVAKKIIEIEPSNVVALEILK